jgi:dihydrofolate reductase
MRKIIVHIATSADGYIARLDGSVDWLNRPQTAGDYGMTAFFKTIDTVLWGRKTWGNGGAGGFGPRVKNYVFSRRSRPPGTHGAEFVNEPVGAFAKRLRAAPGKHIWMMGGAGIIASFLDEGQIDEFVIHIMPIFIGEGIPLIAPRHRSLPLALRSCRRYADGVVRLHYAVEPPAAARKPVERPTRSTRRRKS